MPNPTQLGRGKAWAGIRSVWLWCITLRPSVNGGEALLLGPQVGAPRKSSCPAGQGALCGQSALESRDMGGISVPSVNNPVFSYAALAAGCFRHSQTPPTHTSEGCGQGHPREGGGSAPPAGAFAQPLNGPIEAQAG